MEKKPKIEDYDFVNLFRKIGIEEYDNIAYLKETFNNLKSQVIAQEKNEKGEKAGLSSEDSYIIGKLLESDNEYGTAYYLYAIIRLKKWIKNNSELEQNLKENNSDGEILDMLFEAFVSKNDMWAPLKKQEEEMKNNEILAQVKDYAEKKGSFQEIGIEKGKENDIGHLKEIYDKLRNRIIEMMQEKRRESKEREKVDISPDDNYVIEKLSEPNCEPAYYLYAIIRLNKWIKNDLQVDKDEPSLVKLARQRIDENEKKSGTNLKFKDLVKIPMPLTEEQMAERLNDAVTRIQGYINSIQNNFSMQVEKYIDNNGRNWKNSVLGLYYYEREKKEKCNWPRNIHQKITEYTQEDGTKVSVYYRGPLEYKWRPIIGRPGEYIEYINEDHIDMLEIQKNEKIYYVCSRFPWSEIKENEFFKNVVFSDLNLQEASETRYGYLGTSIDKNENGNAKLNFDLSREQDEEALIHALYVFQNRTVNDMEKTTPNNEEKEKTDQKQRAEWWNSYQNALAQRRKGMHTNNTNDEQER